jgi:hypothetical protein
MPYLQLLNLHPILIFEPLHERIHFMAMGSFRSGEFQQIALLFCHVLPSFHGISGKTQKSLMTQISKNDYTDTKTLLNR